MPKLATTPTARRQLRATPWLTIAALLSSCGRTPPDERVVWSTGAPGKAVRGDYSAGDVAIAGSDTWILYVDGASGKSPTIRIRRRAAGAQKSGDDRVLATLDGASPGLLIRDDGTLVLASLHPTGTGETVIGLRHGSQDGRTWSAPQRISPRSGRYGLASGRLTRSDRDDWFLPATWTDGSAVEIVALRSDDAGTTWNETTLGRGLDLADPAIAAIGTKLLMIARRGSELVRSESLDRGTNWSAFESVGVRADTVAHALESLKGGVALSWTDPPPDSTRAAPGLRALRLSLSTDIGRTWHPMVPLAWRAGAVPECSALAFDEEGLTALIATRSGPTSTLSCIEWNLRQLEPTSSERDRPRGRYAMDPARAASALELLCGQTLQRPAPSVRLFIEGYYMRTLVLAHEVLSAAKQDPQAVERPRVLDTQEGLVRALSFADWMIQGQDEAGYWPLGYRAVFVADMAAVVGLLATLEPYADPERLKHYETSAARFVTALDHDGMSLASGAYGIGWHNTRDRTEDAVAREPYLISTSLAGIEVHSWLYSRTHEERYRTRALAALEYTLSQLQPDGSFPDTYPGGILEGSLMVAAYVEEGWMAADRYLPQNDVHNRWRARLPAHVDWLLRRQSPNGTWGATEPNGEYARTPNIVNFLIWYDEKVEHREDIRRAVQRASVTFSDPDRWDEIGLSRAGKSEDVFRAIAGRALAALAADRSVF